MIEDAVKDLGQALGLPSLALDQAGHLAWEGEGVTLHLQRTDAGLLVYTAVPMPDRNVEALTRALEACHFRYGHPFALRPALTDENELVLSGLLEEAATAALIHQACTLLITVTRRLSQPA
jgi:type III secretion system chaperone SycN